MIKLKYDSNCAKVEKENISTKSAINLKIPNATALPKCQDTKNNTVLCFKCHATSQESTNLDIKETIHALSKQNVTPQKLTIREKQNIKSVINVDEYHRLNEVVSDCENYKVADDMLDFNYNIVTEDSVMDIDYIDLEALDDVILDYVVVENNNLIITENCN
ncbi:hypothetical protein M0802_005331 [Mischocyttarus mexicanus]|nr:hypothetical protein M0802_005331 [Mischocyttarus mexicanus]